MAQSLSQPIHGGNLAWAAALAGCSPSFVLDFSASISPLGPPKSAIDAIQHHLGDLTAYPDPDYTDLRLALGQFHQISADWILPGNGSAELLTWAGRELAHLKATYLLTPAFGDYFRSLKAFGGKVIGCPFPEMDSVQSSCLVGRDWLTRASSLANSSLANMPIKDCGLLLNNPHNPTGCLFTKEDLLPYLAQFALVVVDEAFMDFLPPGEGQSVIPWVQEYPNLVVLRSLTKFYSLPGLRIGYAVAHPDRLRQWQQWRDPWSVSTLASAAAQAVVQDEAFQHQTWAWLAATRPPFQQSLAELPGLQPYAGAANFLLVQSSSSATEIQLRLLQQHRILIRDCLSFPELGDRHFRVAVRTAAENQRLLAGLAEILSG